MVPLPGPRRRGYHERFNRSRFVKKIVLLCVFLCAPDLTIAQAPHRHNTAVALVAKF
jgi:hypothetical protein